MENVTFLDTTDKNGSIVTFVIIDRGDAEFTSMLKSDYEAQQAEQSTPNPTGLFNE